MAQAKNTKILVECVSTNTVAMTELKSEVAQQGHMNRTALENQAEAHKNANRGIRRAIQNAECAGSGCPLSSEAAQKVVDYVSQKNSS